MKLALQSAADQDPRAHLYLFLANLLAAPADRQLLSMAARLDGGEHALGLSIRALAASARATTEDAVAAEYGALFIGVGRGELVPYASYYLTGFVNERPLVRLRNDMAALGIARRGDSREPEDHIAALCEMRSGLVGGAFGQDVDEVRRRAFFDTHLRPWAPRFFRDLERAGAARFYASVGRFGRALVEFDAELLEAAG